MKLAHVRALLYMIVIFCGTGCTKGTPQAPVPIRDIPAYQEYTVIYNKTLNTTDADVLLRLEGDYGDPINMYDTAITMNGAQSCNGTWALSGLQQMNMIFTRKNMAYVNTVSVTDIDDISFAASTPTEIIRSSPTTYSWDGPALSANETASIEFIPQAGTGGYAGYGLGLTGNVIDLLPRTMSDLPAGNYTMQLKRRKTIPVQQQDNTAGGIIKIVLITERQVTLK